MNNGETKNVTKRVQYSLEKKVQSFSFIEGLVGQPELWSKVGHHYKNDPDFAHYNKSGHFNKNDRRRLTNLLKKWYKNRKSIKLNYASLNSKRNKKFRIGGGGRKDLLKKNHKDMIYKQFRRLYCSR